MRFQVASDLHLEQLHRFPGYRIIEPADGADMLILAGDIAAHTHGLELFAGWPVPVAYVHGNHEGHSAHLWGLIRELRRRAGELGIHYLERNELMLQDIRVLGCCLWTDYALEGNRVSAMREAKRAIPDHQSIRVAKGGFFEPSHALTEHQLSRAWLEAELRKPFVGKTVVVTHHAPHRASIHPKYAGDSLNGAFASDLAELVGMADAWVSGHLHHSVDRTVGRCRLVANPAGYAVNGSSARGPAELRFQNLEFNPSLVIEV